MRYLPAETALLNNFDLNGFLGLTEPSKTNWSPVYELEENEKEFKLFFDLPGFEKEKINLEVKDGTLYLSGERERNAEAKGYTERFYGKFTRQYSLPENVNTDELKAGYVDGVLSVDLPKHEVSGPKKISIS